MDIGIEISQAAVDKMNRAMDLFASESKKTASQAVAYGGKKFLNSLKAQFKPGMKKREIVPNPIAASNEASLEIIQQYRMVEVLAGRQKRSILTHDEKIALSRIIKNHMLVKDKRYAKWAIRYLRQGGKTPKYTPTRKGISDPRREIGRRGLVQDICRILIAKIGDNEKAESSYTQDAYIKNDNRPYGSIENKVAQFVTDLSIKMKLTYLEYKNPGCVNQAMLNGAGSIMHIVENKLDKEIKRINSGS